MKLREMFSRNRKVNSETTVKIDVYSDPVSVDPGIVSSTVINNLIVQGYSITTSDLVDMGVTSLDPVTGEKLRRNGRYAKFKIIKHSICGSKVSSNTIDKKSDVDAFLHVRECETVHQLQDVVNAITTEIKSNSQKAYVRVNVDSVKTKETDK